MQNRFWKAVEERDSTFDGRFVYAVRSTGVYCRPSCPSRRPLRAGVLFFDNAVEAEKAGFRACLRCKGKPAGESLGSRVCRYVDEHLKDESRITLAALSAAFQVSPYHLQRTFKRTIGVSPREYAEARRMGLWKSRMRQTGPTECRDVTTALYEAGYGSSSRLYEKASARLGMTPAIYRKGGAGMKIEYVISDCALGRVLVAFTGRGVSAVYLGEDDGVMESALHSEYPRAEIQRGHRSEWVTELLAYLKGKHRKLDLPLDLAATAFQMQVWAELRRIPYGSTRTYLQIARGMGRPTAARAVARACATNPVSVVVPCHRVVREDGDLAGYRWGLARKQALLAAESR